MKRYKGLLVFVLMFASILFLGSTKCFAEDIQYTDNVIPKMTSNTSPGGKASVSSEWSTSGSYAAYKAFDHATNGIEGWASKSTSGWLEYEFLEAKCITKYTLQSRSQVSYTIKESPKNWTFEAWNNVLNKWIVLDERSGVTDWNFGVKKEFTFKNTNYYTRYRINVTESADNINVVVIGEMEMMETVTTPISTPLNVVAIGGNSKVDLTWDAVNNATGYNIKRSETAGGPYTTISSVSGPAITYTDKKVSPGTKYYYVITTVNENGESVNSNEASAIPTAPVNVLKLVLEKNESKQLSVSDELSDNTNLTWVSSNPAVATVDANGKVKASKPGDTVITCTSADGEYIDKINVLVVNLNYQLAVDLHVGEKCRLTVDDLKDTAKVTWTVNDPSIATVSNKGRVTAVSEGLTFVTATDETGKIIGQIYIRVRQ